jgi:hypothetical protein
VLFFAALSGRRRNPRSWLLLGPGIAGFVVCTLLLITYPTLI